ncbi:MAG TPA: hypothetical protein VFH68_25115 [Polyangia bacterium]|jgi:hypothetical protein|nr:hypothetical protein [Polyangia bacterium]
MAFDRRAGEVGESLLCRHAAWLLVCFAYLFVFPYFERINNPNENVRIWATRAIVDHHVLNIDLVTREWGYVNDKATIGGHLYSSKAPGTSFLGVPVLWTQTQLHRLARLTPPSKREATMWLRVFSVELPMCLFLFFFARHVERVTGSPTARDLLVVGLGAGTMLYPYSVIFVGHAQAAALAFSGYMLLAGAGKGDGGRAGPGAAPAPAPAGGWFAESPRDLDRSPPSPATLVWAGVLTALSVVFEYQAVLVCAAVSAYGIYRYRRRAGPFFAGAGAVAALLGLYHTVLFGRPWRFPYAYLENPEFLRQHHSAGFHGLALPKLGAIGSALFSADYGLFIFSPVLALGLVCAVIVALRGDRLEGALVIVVTALMLLFLGGMTNWRAGWCVGPRYIATVVPFLIAGIAQAWRVVRPGARFALSVTAAGLILASVVLNAVSAAVYPHYPTDFDNPVFDLAFPLLGAGFVPYSLGWLVMPGLWSLAPLALALLVALSLGAAGESWRPARWALHGALAMLIAVAFLIPLSLHGRAPNPGEARATAFVRSTWEPRPAAN